jgi:hypothetical protein
MSKRAKPLLALLGIIFVGLFFRTYNLNWDQHHHLHPDERFLTMMALELKIPDSFTDYLDPNVSTLNPRNMGYNFYVYGTFPITLNKIIATVFGNDTYNDYTLQGRLLSGLAETLLIGIIFVTARKCARLYDLPLYSAYFASWLYATIVLSMQLSHFFTTDTFTNLFVFASASMAFSVFTKMDTDLKRRIPAVNVSLLIRIVLAGFWFGLALASKISAILALPLIGLMIVLPLLKAIGNPFNSIKQSILLIRLAVFIGFILLLATYSSLRIADPTFFASSSFFNPSVNPKLIQNIKELKSWEGAETWFPPAIQWIPTKPWIFPLFNLSLYGIGIPHAFFFIVGLLAYIAYAIAQKKHRLLMGVIVLWLMLFFVYQGAQFVKAMRYFLIMLPLLSLVSGLGVAAMFSRLKRNSKLAIWSLSAIFSLSLLVWPLLFLSVYTHPNTRVEASEWIHENLASSAVVNESWDDPLPLLIPQTTKSFPGEMMPVFDPESPQKWRVINVMLESADYYLLTSNRAWGSISKVPEKYPETAEFYRRLFAEEMGFVKVAEFTSRPSLHYLGIPFELYDDDADETFTVYDHPKVIIMAKKDFIPFEPR